MRYTRLIKLLVITLSLMSLFSCATHNLYDISKRNAGEIDTTIFLDDFVHVLKPDDKITVSIWNHDDLSVGSLFGIYNSNEVYGKWVLLNDSGDVYLPQIGKVNLLGLTLKEAERKLYTVYAKFIVDPIIVVKILNREVTVLGQVFKSGKYLLEKEKNTIYDVISMAEGLDFYADKKHVKFIRNDIPYILDLTDEMAYENYNFDLIDGDIIYVPTRKGKMFDSKITTIIPLTSLVTASAIIASFFQN